MSSTYEAVLAAYEKSNFTDGPWTRNFYRRGSGPAVIIMHEMPGLNPATVRFADRVVEAGMTVFLPRPIRRAGTARKHRLRNSIRHHRTLYPEGVQCLAYGQVQSDRRMAQGARTQGPIASVGVDVPALAMASATSLSKTPRCAGLKLLSSGAHSVLRKARSSRICADVRSGRIVPGPGRSQARTGKVGPANMAAAPNTTLAD